MNNKVIDGECWETANPPSEPEVRHKSSIPYWMNVKRPTLDKRKVKSFHQWPVPNED